MKSPKSTWQLVKRIKLSERFKPQNYIFLNVKVGKEIVNTSKDVIITVSDFSCQQLTLCNHTLKVEIGIQNLQINTV